MKEAPEGKSPRNLLKFSKEIYEVNSQRKCFQEKLLGNAIKGKSIKGNRDENSLTGVMH